jgi:hypothetical protein
MSTAKEIVVLLTGIHDFYGKPLSKFAIDLWVDALQPFDIEALEAAFRAHLADPEACQFLPKPGEIIGRLTVRQADVAHGEWAGVLTAARTAGAVRLSEAGRQALDAIGGMYAVRMCQESEIQWLAKRFMEAHQSAGRREAVHQIHAIGHDQGRLQ